MSASVGVDYHFTASSATSGLDRRAATLHAKNATAVAARWNSSTDTLTSDSVNVGADLGTTAPGTPTAKLTSSLAQLLKGASHVDPATGAREINQGIGDTLASQVGQLLTGGGFSQEDAAKASTSLVQQLSSASPGAGILALSLSNQNQTTGHYTASVAGGQKASTWSIQSTTTLNVAFDLASGDLSVKLDQHKAAATQIEWSSSTASNVSIELTEPELEAITFAEDGTTGNATGSPVQESQTTTVRSIPDAPGSFVGVGNVPGPDGLKQLLALVDGASASSSSHAGSTTLAGGNLGNVPASLSNHQSPGETAVSVLKKIVEKAKLANAEQGQPTTRSVKISIAQQVGIAGASQAGGKFFLYNRPAGDMGLINIPGVSVQT